MANTSIPRTTGEAQSQLSDLGADLKSRAKDIKDTVQETASDMVDRAKDAASCAATNVTDTIERGRRYLEEEGLAGIGKDVTGLIQRYPIPSLLIGIGVGFLLAQATRRS